MAKGATMEVVPSTGSYSVGQIFTTTVRVDSDEQALRGVESVLKFDTDMLSVIRLDTEGSAYTSWTIEPTFSNFMGVIEFGGTTSIPTASMVDLISVTWQATGTGTVDMVFEDLSVVTEDGQTIETSQVAQPYTFTITEEPSPVVSSDVFIDSEAWYNTKNGIFNWSLPLDAQAVAVKISDSSDNQPELNEEAIHEPPVSQFKLTPDLVKEGVQYLSLKFKTEAGWGSASNHKIKIDTTPPQDFKINVESSGGFSSSFPNLIFNTKDELSGIDHYEVMVVGTEPVKVTPQDIKTGYQLKNIENGVYSVKVTAYDKAGNTRVSTRSIPVTAGWVNPNVTEKGGPLWDFLTSINLLLIFLVTTIIVLLIYIWHEKNKISIKEQKLRHETIEAQEQMGKIFSALRDEIYDQINMITKRKRLSKKEKEAVDGLNKALEVSETLIEKEVNDVNDLLR